MTAWESVLIAIVGNALVLAVLGVLAKSLLDKLIARDSKQFETELKATADATIERLRSELQQRTIEHQVRFSKLHEKRAEVVAELYSLLVQALWDSESFLSPMQWAGDPDPKAKHATAMNSIVAAYQYFVKHRIYLPGHICDAFEKLIRDARSEVIRLGVWVNFDERSLPSHSQEQKYQSWTKAWETLKNEISLATKALEEEFRGLLGGSSEEVNGGGVAR